MNLYRIDIYDINETFIQDYNFIWIDLFALSLFKLTS